MAPAAFAFGTDRFLAARRGLPCLTLTRDGIALKTLFRTKRANWKSLGPFKLKLAGHQTYCAIADVLDATASRSLFWKFEIPDAFSLGIEPLVMEINARRAQALGEPVKPRAEYVSNSMAPRTRSAGG
jgi:hypothetical protein